MNWALREQGRHASLRELYKRLLARRRDTPALRNLDLGAVEAHAGDEKRVLLVSRGRGSERVVLAFNFSGEAQTVQVPFDGRSVTLQPYGFDLWSTPV